MPKSPAGVRRLPPTPVSPTSATSSPTNSFAMPEPEPYHEPMPSPQRSPDSYMSSSGPNDLLRRATAGSVNNRRLPQAPNGTTFSDGAKPPVPPFPYENRFSTQASYDASTGLSAGDRHSTLLTRSPTYRPPGALPPAVPGHYGQHAPAYDTYNGDGRTHYANGYYKPVDTRQFQAPMLPGSSSPQNVPIGLPKPFGQEYPTPPSESVVSSLPSTSFPTSTDEPSQCLYLACILMYT